MNNPFKELQAKHIKLLDRYQEDKDSEELVNDVREYIKQTSLDSRNISNNRERNQLRANIRYWASYLYDKTGTYYSTDLAPPIIENRSQRLFRGITISLFVTIIGAAILTWIVQKGRFALLTNIPTASATNPSVSPTAKPTVTPTKRSTPDTNLPIEIIVPSGAIMRLVPNGEFTMGNNAEMVLAECLKYSTDCQQNSFADEEPPHIVFLDAFYMDQHEVTNAGYKLCVDAGECQPPRESKSYTRSSYYGNPEFSDYPVIYVDWNMSKTYCEWRGARLPTEAEWEKAARGTDGRTYPWGEGLDCNHANYGQNNTGACESDTTPVGSYESGQSVYGLYDMAGNVSEWVSSLYKPYPYNAYDGREDLEASGVRVFRGGSWNYNTGDVRPANRNGYSSAATNDIGFRCAKDP